MNRGSHDLEKKCLTAKIVFRDFQFDATKLLSKLTIRKVHYNWLRNIKRIKTTTIGDPQKSRTVLIESL